MIWKNRFETKKVALPGFEPGTCWLQGLGFAQPVRTSLQKYPKWGLIKLSKIGK